MAKQAAPECPAWKGGLTLDAWKTSHNINILMS